MLQDMSLATTEIQNMVSFERNVLLYCLENGAPGVFAEISTVVCRRRTIVVPKVCYPVRRPFDIMGVMDRIQNSALSFLTTNLPSSDRWPML